jgi:hypothetical protein
MESSEAEGFAAQAARGVAAALESCDVDRATSDAVLRLAAAGPGVAPSAPGAADRVLAALREPRPGAGPSPPPRGRARALRRAARRWPLVFGDVHGEHVAPARALARFCGRSTGCWPSATSWTAAPGRTSGGRSSCSEATPPAWQATTAVVSGAKASPEGRPELPGERRGRMAARPAQVAHGGDGGRPSRPRAASSTATWLCSLPRAGCAHRGWAPLVASGPRSMSAGTRTRPS